MKLTDKFKNTLPRRILSLSLAAGMGMSLAACGANWQQQAASIEQQVQADANVLCGFIPTIGTIAAFIPGFGTIAASAATIASGICAAVAAAPPIQTQSAKMRSLASNVDVQVSTFPVPGQGTVAIVGHFTR